MYLLYAAKTGKLSALNVRVAITADTGSELDCQMMNGERISAPDFFRKYVVPLAESAGIESLLVRTKTRETKTREGVPIPPLIQIVRESSVKAASGSEFKQIVSNLGVPLFTNDESAGRLLQSCTDKWKVRAIKQAAKARKIKMLRSVIGYHYDEAARRIDAIYLRQESGFDFYKPYRRRRVKGVMKKIPSRWEEQIYPLVDWRMGREQIAEELNKAGIPFLITSECDHCPHQDYERWSRHSSAVIDDLAEIEARWNGKLFFTDRRIPLKEALEQMKKSGPKRATAKAGLLFSTFGCGSDRCGI